MVVGLILGTRMWYPLWDAEKDDDAAFERRLDSVIREIGERGQVLVCEAVPPLREMTPEPAQASLPAAPLAPVPPRAASTQAPAPSRDHLTQVTTSVSSTKAPASLPAPAPAPVPPRAQVTTSTTGPSGPAASQRALTPSVGPPDTPAMVMHPTRHTGEDNQLISIAFMREEREHLERRVDDQKCEMNALREDKVAAEKCGNHFWSC